MWLSTLEIHALGKWVNGFAFNIIEELLCVCKINESLRPSSIIPNGLIQRAWSQN